MSRDPARQRQQRGGGQRSDQPLRTHDAREQPPDLLVQRAAVTLQGAEIRIRDAGPDDIDAAGAVVRAAYQQFESVYPGESWERYITMVGELRPRAGEGEIIVAERVGDLVHLLRRRLEIGPGRVAGRLERHSPPRRAANSARPGHRQRPDR